MADFNQALAYVLGNEGIYSDNLDDRGGPTHFGITEATASKHGLDVETLTKEQAASIYLSDYWRFDQIADQRVATKLMDMAVNFGLTQAITILQTILNVNSPAPLAIDGKFGSLTIAAVNRSQSFVLIRDLALESCRRYAHLAGDRSQLTFLRGWILRAVKIPPKEA